MKVVDVNVLLYAVNPDLDPHGKIRRWWEHALAGDESIGLPWLVLSGFLRISTNPRVYAQTLTVDEALGQVEGWLSAEIVTTISEKPDHWGSFRKLLSEAGTAGILTTDAHLAALAISHDATLVSCDNDFARFADLRWEKPDLGDQAVTGEA